MHHAIRRSLCCFAVASLLFSAQAHGASVGPEGYSNAFTNQPSAEDWATASRPGLQGDAYDTDADVNAFIVASAVTNQTIARPNNPPGLLTNATWSSIGFYLQTRPTGNRYTALMAKFVNNTGTNATEIAVSYLLTIAGGSAAEDIGKGTRVYYSLTGTTNSWINITTLNAITNSGSSNLSAIIHLNWPEGANLYLLWADDNALPTTDVANQIDNFSLLITAGTLPSVRATLIAPANNAVLLSDSSITTAATIIYGTPPYVVEYWTNGGAGNTTFQLAGSSTTPPYNVSLGALSAGTYNLYATVIDENGAGTNDTSLTNTFFVVDPITLTLTAPANGANIEQTQSVAAAATVSGGTGPYAVQFFLNGVSNGVSVTSTPYSRDFGTLALGYYTVSATVTDARGWRSNSLVNTFRVIGPLAVTFKPANGTSFYARQSVTLTALPVGGDPPYTVSFFTNGQRVASLNSAPFTTNLGALRAGSYTVSMHVTDSSVPTQQIHVTNVITVVSNPPITVTHVIQMSLDGLGAKYLEFFLTNAPAQFPNFVRLTAESAFTMNARCDYDISETVPNHATMFTARPVFQPVGQNDTVHHGYDNNFPGDGDTLHASGNANVPYKASVFDTTHDYGLSTALYTGKTRLSVCERSYNETNGAPDVVGADNGRDKIDFASVADVSGANISNEVNLLIQNLTNTAPTRYSFIHIAEPDLTGHASGWRSANWSNAVRAVDAQIGRIISTIDANPILSNRIALIITADHGGGGVAANGHTESYHVTNYTIPFFVRAPGIPPGADLYTLFANRGDPGTNRTDYTIQPQPIRNGDASNLALKLLGLPPITGSFMVPQLYEPAFSLSIARFQGQIGIFWSDPAAEYVLEAAESLSPAVQWQTITNGIVTNDTTRIFSVTNAGEFPARLFRLRQLGQ